MGVSCADVRARLRRRTGIRVLTGTLTVVGCAAQLYEVYGATQTDRSIPSLNVSTHPVAYAAEWRAHMHAWVRTRVHT